MSPSQTKARSIRVLVPRHNAQRPTPALADTIEAVARARNKRVRTDVRSVRPRRLSASEPNPLAVAVESASEWNSLLITARAERGPQWDVPTQQFMVDEGSELYYDPSPLRQRDEKDGGRLRPSSSAPTPVLSPQVPRHPYGNPTQSPHPGYNPFGGPPGGQFHPGMGMGTPGGGVPPGAFYGADGASPVKGLRDASPYSPAGMDRRRSTRGMGMGMPDNFPGAGMYGS